MTERYVIEDYEELPYEPEEDYWNEEMAPPYDKELDFNKDPVTEYLPEEDEYDDEAHEYVK